MSRKRAAVLALQWAALSIRDEPNGLIGAQACPRQRRQLKATWKRQCIAIAQGRQGGDGMAEKGPRSDALNEWRGALTRCVLVFGALIILALGLLYSPRWLPASAVSASQQAAAKIGPSFDQRPGASREPQGGQRAQASAALTNTGAVPLPRPPAATPAGSAALPPAATVLSAPAAVSGEAALQPQRQAGTAMVDSLVSRREPLIPPPIDRAAGGTLAKGADPGESFASGSLSSAPSARKSDGGAPVSGNSVADDAPGARSGAGEPARAARFDEEPAGDAAINPASDDVVPARAKRRSDERATRNSRRASGSSRCTTFRTYNARTQTYRAYDGSIKACKPDA
jgi:hypothetical protein